MRSSKKQLMRVPLCVYVCGLVVTAVKLQAMPRLGMKPMSLFGLSAVVLFCFIALCFLDHLPRHDVAASAAICSGLAVLSVVLQWVLDSHGMSDNALYLYVLLPINYFGSSLRTVLETFSPQLLHRPLQLITAFAPMLFSFFGKKEEAAAEDAENPIEQVEQSV